MKEEWLTEEWASKRWQILEIEFALLIKVVTFYRKSIFITQKDVHTVPHHNLVQKCLKEQSICRGTIFVVTKNWHGLCSLEPKAETLSIQQRIILITQKYQKEQQGDEKFLLILDLSIQKTSY